MVLYQRLIGISGMGGPKQGNSTSLALLTDFFKESSFGRFKITYSSTFLRPIKTMLDVVAYEFTPAYLSANFTQ